MSLDSNEAVVRRLIDEVSNAWNMDVIDEIVADGSEDPRCISWDANHRT